MSLTRLLDFFFFGCHHSNLSRVFTIGRRTYRACSGGWAALAGSSQPAIEPVCYLGLADNSAPARDIEQGIWPVLSGDDEEGTWVNHDPVFKEREQECGGTEVSRTFALKVSHLPRCGCNCGCTLRHFTNVSSVCKWSSVRARLL
jgi:hypothetical protein